MPISSVRRIGVALALVASALAMVLVTPSTASAAPCVVGPEYSGTATIGVTPAGPVRPGEEITCTATGFPGNVAVTFAINPTLGTSDSNAEGTATITTTMPAQSTFDGPGCGPQTVTATGGGATASTSVTITCPTTPATTTAGSLPRTGSDSGRLSGIALALVAMGGLVVLAARRRSASAA